MKGLIPCVESLPDNGGQVACLVDVVGVNIGDGANVCMKKLSLEREQSQMIALVCGYMW